MKVDACRRSGRPKKIWVNCVRIDMVIKSVNIEMAADRVEEETIPRVA